MKTSYLKMFQFYMALTCEITCEIYIRDHGCKGEKYGDIDIKMGCCVGSIKQHKKLKSW